ncbi:endolytic transglycosylase MltG [Pseudobacteroides cellulosolvens]|uniref:endolytic transglycosylase MltG n=1 Tax=Pseudobacteroides cellulosolvens TaxID=35825 RepID=UPI0006804829|nr:endolytic transglycosylase MltG [Pseudobacteroides cellulosolvens]
MVVDLGNSKKAVKKKKFIIRFVIILSLICVFFTSAAFSYNYVLRNQDDSLDKPLPVIPESKGIQFEVPRGATSAQITDKLAEEGIIKNTFMFKMISKINGFDGTYKSGTHILSKDLDYDSLMRILSSDPVTSKVLIPEGYTLNQITDKLYKDKLIDKAKFANVALNEKFDYKFLKGIPQREKRLEGYLFPDTYNFDVKSGEKAIIDRMLSRFDEVFKPEYYEKAKALGLTVHEVIILASIIEREAKEYEERRLISGVFYNRLKSKNPIHKKLQSCATIQYILLNKTGEVKPKLTDADTKINDPYNTYLHEGLPPGPICCPGKESIEAALEPETTDYYYFVSKGDGTHEFSTTLSQHQAAVKKYGLFN